MTDTITTAEPDTMVDAVRLAHLGEARRYAAMRDADVDVLDELLSPHLVYTHSTSVRETKASYLLGLSSGDVRYEDVSYTIDTSVPVGDVVVLTGTMRGRVRRAAGARRVYSLTTAVWSIDQGRHELLAFSATAVV